MLSERETEVLKLLSKGLSNKEIADSLNISIHTVISHRKNLTQKTGIKSQSGLTIYALSNNIISLENL
ncbi:MAG: helix-turn-helix transcriptional regulator [Bacteroidales bacterium]|nr:helix-turn-helix transcriptional regulator [Bacteroidales bacterium]